LLSFILNKILEINPKFIRAYNLKALIYLKLKHYQEALNCIEEGLDIENDAKRILLPNRAALLYKLGRINEAKEFVDKALEINPDYTSGLLHKARLMLEIDPNESIRICDDIIKKTLTWEKHIILNLVLMHY
jgi:tetratricopeptide (TPR) repeat protein